MHHVHCGSRLGAALYFAVGRTTPLARSGGAVSVDQHDQSGFFLGGGGLEWVSGSVAPIGSTNFVLGGADLHDDEDERAVTILSDDERPFVMYDDQARTVGPRSEEEE